jgi:hypothetical protein
LVSRRREEIADDQYCDYVEEAVKNRTTRFIALVTACGSLLYTPTMAEAPVTLVVNRPVVPAGSDLLVTIRVPRDAANRSLTIEADSEDYSRSSTMPLDGEFEAYTRQYWFKQLPEGEYDVMARVSGTKGVRGVAALTVNVVGTLKRK